MHIAQYVLLQEGLALLTTSCALSCTNAYYVLQYKTINKFSFLSFIKYSCSLIPTASIFHQRHTGHVMFQHYPSVNTYYTLTYNSKDSIACVHIIVQVTVVNTVIWYVRICYAIHTNISNQTVHVSTSVLYIQNVASKRASTICRKDMGYLLSAELYIDN